MLAMLAMLAILASSSGCSPAEAVVVAEPKLVEQPAQRSTNTWPPDFTRLSADLVPAARTTNPQKVLLRGATIMTAAGSTIENGDLLLVDGRIEAVSAEHLAVDDDVRVIDARGKFVTPGLIDTHSHLGVYPSPSVEGNSDGNEATDPITADIDALNGIWPQDPGFERALAGGITALQVLPGSANLVGGRAVTLELRRALSSRAMVFAGAPKGVKMACGENPKRVYGARNARPSTRMGSAAALRSAFQRARELQTVYRRHERAFNKWQDNAERKLEDRPDPPTRNYGLETLIGIMDGTLLLHVHCYRADEMVQILEIADEFDFKVRSFHHAIEAYKVRALLAERGVSVSTWADWWGFKMEANDAIVENLALLSQAGARAIVHSDSQIGIQRLNQEAAKGYHAGLAAGLELTEDDALRWITANAAWALGIHNHTGTLEPGKRADVVLWSAHPFSVYARAELVFVGGELEFDIAQNPVRPWSDFEAARDHNTEVTP